jgi:hypothetical protein
VPVLMQGSCAGVLLYSALQQQIHVPEYLVSV